MSLLLLHKLVSSNAFFVQLCNLKCLFSYVDLKIVWPCLAAPGPQPLPLTCVPVHQRALRVAQQQGGPPGADGHRPVVCTSRMA